MHAHRLEATVSTSGSLQLTQLPFQPGEVVEIIILAREDALNAPTPIGAAPSSTGLTATSKPTRKSQRRVALAAIQHGKYAPRLAASDVLPSVEFAANKQAEHPILFIC